MMADGKIYDFQKLCTKVETSSPAYVSFLDNNDAVLAVVPAHNIWVIYSSDMNEEFGFHELSIEDFVQEGPSK